MLLSTGFARWDLEPGHAFAVLADSVQVGDQVILAVTRAKIQSSAELTGELEGSIEEEAVLFAL